jgi:flavin-dependent dehydrogenase
VVREGHQVLEASLHQAEATLRVADPEGHESTLRVGVVVDASGRSGLLAKKLGHHERDPLLCNISVHAHYEGIPREAGRRGGDIRMLTRSDMGWIWLIPISETVMSVGAVIPLRVHGTEARATAEENLDHYLSTTLAAPALLKDARRVSPARFDADYSYLGSRLAGDRWVAVGDAAAFLDPIFSTGVLLAMQTGLEAAAVIDEALRDGDLGGHRFAEYERVVRRRYHHFRRFAAGFYDPNFRDLWFTPSSRFGLYEAVLSVLAGNWRPSLATRIRIWLFFVLVRLQRYLPLAPRTARVAGDHP